MNMMDFWAQLESFLNNMDQAGCYGNTVALRSYARYCAAENLSRFRVAVAGSALDAQKTLFNALCRALSTPGENDVRSLPDRVKRLQNDIDYVDTSVPLENVSGLQLKDVLAGTASVILFAHDPNKTNSYCCFKDLENLIPLMTDVTQRVLIVSNETGASINSQFMPLISKIELKNHMFYRVEAHFSALQTPQNGALAGIMRWLNEENRKKLRCKAMSHASHMLDDFACSVDKERQKVQQEIDKLELRKQVIWENLRKVWVNNCRPHILWERDNVLYCESRVKKYQ